MEWLAKIPAGVYYAGFGLIAFLASIFAGLIVLAIIKKVRLRYGKAEIDPPDAPEPTKIIEIPK